MESKQPPSDNALTLAAFLKDSRFLQALLKTGADLNATVGNSRETCLEVACFYRRTNNVALLIAAGAKINRQSSNGATPLHAAIRQSNYEAARFLYRNGADPTVKDIWNLSAVDTLRKYKDFQYFVTSADKKAYPILLRELKNDGKL